MKTETSFQHVQLCQTILFPPILSTYKAVRNTITAFDPPLFPAIFPEITSRIGHSVRLFVHILQLLKHLQISMTCSFDLHIGTCTCHTLQLITRENLGQKSRHAPAEIARNYSSYFSTFQLLRWRLTYFGETAYLKQNFKLIHKCFTAIMYHAD